MYFDLGRGRSTIALISFSQQIHLLVFLFFFTTTVGLLVFPDPFLLRSTIGNLGSNEEEWMLETLLRLKRCHGQHECHHAEQPPPSTSRRPKSATAGGNSTRVIAGHKEILEPSIWEKIFGT